MKDYERLLSYEIPDVHVTRSERDTILYALGIGLGADPVNPKELRFVYEKELLALPTMALSLCAPHAWVKQSGTGFGRRSVTSWQSFVLHRPISVAGEFYGRAKVISVVDKGPGRGAIVTAARELFAGTGEHIASLEADTFCRGDGGFGGPTAPVRTPHPLPESNPHFSCEVHTLPQAALMYRLSGDYNPLHVDPTHARAVGFPRPNLHGLCTMGIAGYAIIKTLCDYDALALKSMEARFTAPVYPGDTLRTEMWIAGAEISYRAVVPERGNVVVIDNGHARLARILTLPHPRPMSGRSAVD